jgi:hypothetical protein
LACHLAQVTRADAYDFERRLGDRPRYVQRDANPLETVGARYVEELAVTV